MSADEMLKHANKIKRWRNDDRQGYDAVIDLVCRAETLLRKAASRLAAPVGEMPPIEVGDWVQEKAPDKATRIVAITPSNHDVWCSGKYQAYVTEIRKADGRVWRRHAEP